MKNLALGDQIQMGKNATMAWGQITSQPFIPKTAGDVGALPSNSPRLTWIGSDGIYTGWIDADNITTGTLSADRISTEISRVNKDLYLGTSYQSSSSLAFVGIGGIAAHDNNLYFSAMEGIVFQTPTFFSTVLFTGDADFSNANVTGIKVRLG